MRYLSFLMTLSMAVAGLLFPSAGLQTGSAEAAPRTAAVKRGEYLVTIMGCADCHSPRGADGNFLKGLEFSGHPQGAPVPEWNPEMLKKGVLMTMNPTGTAFAGPWGVTFGGNLTPDKETGIGTLTAEGLIKSWRTNKHWKFPERDVLPPMPTPAYSALTDEDIRAVHAYLFTLKPIKNKVPLLIPPAKAEK